LARVPRKVPCLWTYWELGLDLGSGHSIERRRLFSDIVQALGWPSGSLVFWPMSQADERGLTLRDDCFWEGVRLVQPHSIVCFGEQAFQALFPDRPCRYGWFDLKECSCLFIPGPADMLPDNRQAKQIVWQALRELKPLTTG